MKRLDEMEPANAPAKKAERGEPATLRELGLPEELARGLEQAFDALGHTRDGRVVGFEFARPDGTRHAVRLEEAA
jgi:hypothetical protein